MTMGKTDPRVDAYLRKVKRWPEEIRALRTIILDCGLTEEVKWRIPCYTLQNKNVVIVNGLKEFCALAFFKGALLKDARGILTAPGPNTQAGRWIKLTSVRQIVEMEPVLKAYIQEAIEAEKAGLKVRPKKNARLVLPEELRTKFDEIPALKTAFHALTPGRQRAYVLHFSAPKQSKTRESRIAKCAPQILAGKGLHDEYRSMRKSR